MNKTHSVWLLILCIFLFHSCKWGERTYHVVVDNIPTQLKYNNSFDQISYYILDQIYEPLFVRERVIKSSMLSSWNVSSDYKRFRFCVKDNLRLSNGKLFTSTVLDLNFKRWQENQTLTSQKFSSQIESNCLSIVYEKPFFKLLYLLSMDFRYAILDPETFESDLPAGYGPYILKSNNGKLLRLQKNPNYTDKIYFQQIEIFNFAQFQNNLDNIHEINLLPHLTRKNLPNSVLNKFERSQDNHPMGVYIVLKYDDRVRKGLFHCLPRSHFASLLDYSFDAQSNRTQSILPLSIGKNKVYDTLLQCDLNRYRMSKREILEFYLPKKQTAYNTALFAQINESISRLNIELKFVILEPKVFLQSLASSAQGAYLLRIVEPDEIRLLEDLGMVDRAEENFLGIKSSVDMENIKNLYLNYGVNELDYNHYLYKIQREMMATYQTVLINVKPPAIFLHKKITITSESQSAGFPSSQVKNLRQKFL